MRERVTLDPAARQPSRLPLAFTSPRCQIQRMRFVHTSDWHIGKNFSFADEAAQLLREERLEAIGRIAQLARAQNAATVLVAGDIYDVATPSERTLRQPIERMRAFPEVHWHLIPGNHDAHTARGPWERLARLGDGLPANIHLHLSGEPSPLPGGAWLLPGVLTRRHALGDPTAAMDEAATPEGALRIGLAHGSITSFGSDAASTHNLIALDRAARAGLGYLALGDYHGAQSRGDRIWYSGTPEPDDFGIGGAGGGTALVVDIDGPGAAPVVREHAVGRFGWHSIEARLFGAADIETLEERLRALPGGLANGLVWLHASGALTLGERDLFEQKIVLGAGSGLCVLRLDEAGLMARPTDADLEAIDHAGFVRDAANTLAKRAADAADPEQDIAQAALQRLYVLHKRAEGSARP
jgi:DNA repair exonuclease SbcCD nuclease subunit